MVGVRRHHPAPAPPPRWLKKLDLETRAPAVDFHGSRVGGFGRKLPVTRPAQAPSNKPSPGRLQSRASLVAIGRTEGHFPLHFVSDLRDAAWARRIEGARPAQQRKATSGRARGNSLTRFDAGRW